MLDAGACNFPSKPLAPKPFCAVSGCRQGDSPIKRGRLPVSFFWAACSRPKERGLGHLLVVALARFWRLPGDWRGVGYVTDNDIRHPLSTDAGTSATQHPPPSWRQSLVGQCERDVLYSQASKASFSAVAGHLAAWHPSRNLRSRSGNPGRPPGHTHRGLLIPILPPSLLRPAPSLPSLQHRLRWQSLLPPWSTTATITTSDLGILDVSSLSFILRLLCQRNPRPTLSRALLYLTTGTSAVSDPSQRDFSLDLGLGLNSGPALTCRLTSSLLYASIRKPLGSVPTKTASEARCISRPFSPLSSCR